MIVSALIFIITIVVTLVAIWICATLKEIRELLKDQRCRVRIEPIDANNYKVMPQDLQNVAAIRITKR